MQLELTPLCYLVSSECMFCLSLVVCLDTRCMRAHTRLRVEWKVAGNECWSEASVRFEGRARQVGRDTH